MKKLELTKISVITPQEGGTEVTKISYHRFDTDDANQETRGEWDKEGVLTNDEALEYAKTMIEPGEEIEVSLNLEEASTPENVKSTDAVEPKKDEV